MKNDELKSSNSSQPDPAEQTDDQSPARKPFQAPELRHESDLVGVTAGTYMS